MNSEIIWYTFIHNTLMVLFIYTPLILFRYKIQIDWKVALIIPEMYIYLYLIS